MTALALQTNDFSAQQVELIKQTVAAGTTDLELSLFLEVAKSSGLNPFQRQIYAIKRKSGRDEKMTIQTGIDGYRLIAARSGVHMGTTDPEFGPVGKDGFPEFARVVVRKLVHGQVAEFPATARWSEYVQQKDEWSNGQRTGKKTVTDMWQRMPHTMLGKCAEALALRKAFPAELSGIYSDVEMAQADNTTPELVQAPQQARKADVTREVAELAGVPVQTTEDPRLAKAREQVTAMSTRVRKVAPEDEVNKTVDFYDWRNDVQEAQKCYAELKELGLHYAPKTVEAAPASKNDAETLISADQITQLQAIARSAGATISADRAQLWGYSLNATGPIHTKELSEEQAGTLLGMFGGMSADERKATYEEAKRAAKGVLL